MARPRRTWLQFYPIIRRILREQDAELTEFSQDDLLDAWNASFELRSLEMDNAGEGWGVDAFTVPIVAGQTLYTKPEGAGRIRGVRALTEDGKALMPLTRDDRVGRGITLDASGVSGQIMPRWRPRGDLIAIEPAFDYSRAAGLHVEADSFPLLFTGSDGEMLDLRYPLVLEQLLIFDAVEYLLGIEDQLGNTQSEDPRALSRFQTVHAKYENAWQEYISDTSTDPVYARPMNWGG